MTRRALSRLEHETVVAAATGIQVKSWVYLRDTRRYSIFMEPAGILAYGAVGITDPIKELLGGAGALVETGLLHYDGHIVCDGPAQKPELGCDGPEDDFEL